MPEYIDILNEDGTPAGFSEEKTRAHLAGLWHKTAHVWILDRKGELLLQLRAADKNSHPDKWDISAAGHIVSGETALSGALREMKEELGVKVPAEQLQYLLTTKIQEERRTKRGLELNREFEDVFLVRLDLPESAYRFDDGEVQRVRYVPWRELKAMLAAGALLDGKEILCIDKEYYRRLFERIESLGV